jgi:maltooligosyltrehalose trehalohydrolase
MQWLTSFGAWLDGQGARFRAWAPEAERLDVVIYGRTGIETTHPMERGAHGCFTTWLAGVGAGTRYKYRLNGSADYPDPAARYLPDGVHGPSAVVDARRFPWEDVDWKGRPLSDLVIYELHVGTFTPEGTFPAAARKLTVLRELGVTAIELMPVADFPGGRNWGYDGVSLYAPARCYGTPDDLRRLVNRAHRLELAVLLDVVYNHLGPDGNYLAAFTPYWTAPRHTSPWGSALNFDGPHSEVMREFFLANALYWLQEFHLDGLRLDATHAIRDDSPQHFLVELSARVRRAITGRQVHLIAEDHRNMAVMVKPVSAGGWGLDAVWADDFHHQMRRLLAGDHEAYYQDYTGTTTDLAATVRQGWFFSGQHSAYSGHARGTDPAGLPPAAFVICLQNHDQIGNRAFGERLSHQIDLAAYRAATALLLCAPQTPLLFMGQEWAASSPFLYFTDHNAELGRQVTLGRRREFRHFSAFADPHVRETIPDPQAESTFRASRLNWDERERQPHAGIWHLHRALLHLRRTEPALRDTSAADHHCFAAADTAMVLCRRAGDATLLLVCQFKGAGTVRLSDYAENLFGQAGQWQVLLSTEDPRFAADPQPTQVNLVQGWPALQYLRQGAVLLKQ